ncbi:MAG: hypothetical protein LQ351_000393 [Letrouitia transgressa]|nr:MAG: hypothetical protein LQ351_000393 [Letrouitia transgressa]
MSLALNPPFHRFTATTPATLLSPLISLHSHTHHHHQIRHATIIRRPKRPYTFTQLVTLSDGSTFTHRTTSPAPVYRSTKDTRNTALWNPSSQKLLSVEADEAGRLRAFREKFGRGWDAERMAVRDDDIEAESQREGEPEVVPWSERKEEKGRGGEENLMGLISGYRKSGREKREEVRGREKGGGWGKR